MTLVVLWRWGRPATMPELDLPPDRMIPLGRNLRSFAFMLQQVRTGTPMRPERADLRAGKHLRVDVQLSEAPRDEVGILAAGDSCQFPSHGTRRRFTRREALSRATSTIKTEARTSRNRRPGGSVCTCISTYASPSQKEIAGPRCDASPLTSKV